MKKIISVLIVLTLLLSLFGCGKSDAVKGVQGLIKDIGKISTESAEKIEAALNAYELLPDSEKEKVGNYKALLEAKEEYDNLTDIIDTVDNMIDAAESDFGGTKYNFAEYINNFDELKSRYKKLSSKQKEEVNGFDKLEEAIEKFEGYTSVAQDAAAIYVKAFLKINEGKNYTITKIGCIKQLSGNSQYHLFALIYNDENNEQHCVYSKARYENTDINSRTYQTMLDNPEYFFANEHISEESDPLIYGNIDIDTEKAIAAANA